MSNNIVKFCVYLPDKQAKETADNLRSCLFSCGEPGKDWDIHPLSTSDSYRVEVDTMYPETAKEIFWREDLAFFEL